MAQAPQVVIPLSAEDMKRRRELKCPFGIIHTLRDRLAEATGIEPTPDPKLADDLKAALELDDIKGDPLNDLVTAISLVECRGKTWDLHNVGVAVPQVSVNDQGFTVSHGTIALNMCRALISCEWLEHPGRTAFFEESAR